MLTQTLSYEEIIASVQQAFLPLSCDVKIWEFDAKLRFKILVNGHNIIRTDEVALDYARDAELLSAILGNVRARVQSKGYVLQ
jgi:hypothetical protein